MKTTKNNSEIFKNAWSLYKSNIYYKTLGFGSALRQSWKEARIKKENVISFDLSYSKSEYGATYKQIQYMSSFDNFSFSGGISNSQLMKRLDRFVASEIIGLLKADNQVILNV